MKAKLVRTGKPMSLTAPQFFFARNRATADEAFAGDVVGIPNHGTLRIGDTLTEGEDIVFRGVPNFAPEILRRVRLQRRHEGQEAQAKRCSRWPRRASCSSSRRMTARGAIVGVVGALQLDVLEERLQAEYGLPIDFEQTALLALPLDHLGRQGRVGHVHRGPSARAIARDLDGAPVFLAPHAFQLRYDEERWKEIKFSDVKDYQVRDKAA